LATPSGWSEIAWTLEAVRQQSIAPELEVLVVGQGPEPPGKPSAGSLGSLIWVDGGPWAHRATAAAIGIRAARHELVALLENHARPDPCWAEEVRAGLLQGYAGSAGRFVVENPATMVSRIDVWLYYSYTVGMPSQGAPFESPVLPWHNVMYRRSLLLQLDQPLEWLLLREERLQQALRHRKHRFCLCPRAPFFHLNCSSQWISLLTSHETSRSAAVRRAESWSRSRRWIYALLWPLLGLRRFQRRTMEFRGQLASLGHPLEALMRLALVEWAGAAGEAVGLVWGENPDAFTTRHELRLDHRLNSAELRDYEARGRRILGQATLGVRAPLDGATAK
jgi:hypothetical protein